mgnify:FL=1
MSQPDILTISSYNSLESESASYFEAILPSTVIYPKRMILNKFIMPNLMYDISPNYSFIKMTIIHSVGPTTVTINPQLSTSTHWTSSTSFATYLQTLINTTATSAGIPVSSVVVTYNIETAKLTITANANITFSLSSWDNPNPIAARSAWYKLGNTSGDVQTQPSRSR